MALQVILNRRGIHRILLESYPEGVFVNVFEAADSPGPVQDHYQPDLTLAKKFCGDIFGVDSSRWKEVPDEVWH